MVGIQQQQQQQMWTSRGTTGSYPPTYLPTCTYQLNNDRQSESGQSQECSQA